MKPIHEVHAGRWDVAILGTPPLELLRSVLNISHANLQFHLHSEDRSLRMQTLTAFRPVRPTWQKDLKRARPSVRPFSRYMRTSASKTIASEGGSTPDRVIRISLSRTGIP